MWTRHLVPICMARWCTSGGAGCCRDPRLLHSEAKIEDTAQGDVTLPRLRRELQRLPGQQRLIVGGPNARRAMVQVDLGSDAASGLNGSNGQRCRPGSIWTH